VSDRIPRVKICGVTSTEDATLAVSSGADFIGAILAPGFGRSVAPDLVSTYARGEHSVVGVFVDQRAQDIVSIARTAGLDVLQLHGDETPPLFPVLRSEGTWKLWKAVRVRHTEDIVSAVDRWADLVDAMLFDAHKDGAPGGTGTAFPWEALEAVRAIIPPGLPVILSGGLRPGLVADAMARLSPDVLDVSTGVEASLGRKDPQLVRAFVAAARPPSADVEQLAVNFVSENIAP
jgi:phosphoribosylanthranilate isomerase